MFDAYLDFEINIGARTSVGYPVDVKSGTGGEARGIFIPPLEDPSYQVIANQLELLSADEAALEMLGQILFQAIFQGPIKEVYARTQGGLQEHQGLRVVLNIAASEIELATIPWEFLRDPNHIGPLALLDTPIVRYLPQSTVIPTLATSLPLKVLVTGAQTPPAVHIDRELNAVCEALSSLGDHVQLTVEPHLTSSKLQHLLRSGVHVWHFVGHGSLDQDHKTTVIYLEDNTGGAEAVSAMHLGILLHRSGLRLVMLDTCHGGKLMIDPFRSMAPALIRAQVPAVVAMQFAVPENATRAFASEFYRTLAEGFPIDACVTEGRKAVMNATGLRSADWGIPIVYTRARDGKLFDLPAPAGYVHPEQSNLVPFNTSLERAPAPKMVPEVYSAVVECRDNLHAAGKRLGVLRGYKELHDCFQQLDNCYAIIYRVKKRLFAGQNVDANDIAWEYLGDDVRDFQEIVDKLLNCACQVSVAEARSLFVGALEHARTDLDTAIKQRRPALLEQAIQRVGMVLGRELSRINTLLVDAARDLHLEGLIPILQNVQGHMAELHAGVQIAAQDVEVFHRGVETLMRLSERLNVLTATHDTFQEIDDALRWVEAVLDQDVSELERTWPDLKLKMQGLRDEHQSGWVDQLTATGVILEDALVAGQTAAIKEAFLDYRSQINRSFNRIDQDLRTVCGALRDAGDDLAPILRIVA
jgi:hypothetical protein